MHQNVIYICISWYRKICWFPVKNADVSRTQGVYHMIYLFFGSSLGKSLTVLSFIIVGYVWQTLERGLFCPLDLWAAPKRPTLSRVNIFIKVIPSNLAFLVGLIELLLILTMTNIKTLPTPKHNAYLIFLVAILQLRSNRNFKK